MRLLARLIVAPQRGYDEPATLSYAISSFCPTSGDGLQHPKPFSSKSTPSPKENLAGSIKAAEQRLAGEQSTANYLAAALPLQLSRVEVARKLFQRKLFETHCPGGALKYDEQIAPLLRSAEHDVAHALARLAAVSEGMHDLFGY